MSQHPQEQNYPMGQGNQRSFLVALLLSIFLGSLGVDRFYLGSIGGPAARLAKDCIKHVEVVEYEELGMEAVWKIEVEDFPAFIVVDDKGNDFFTATAKPTAFTITTRPGL